MAKDKLVMVRVETERLDQFKMAAKAEGKTLSAWLRDCGASRVSLPGKARVAVSRLQADITAELQGGGWA